MTYAFGAYDSICNHLDENELPQTSSTTLEKPKLQTSALGKIWDSLQPVDKDPFEEAFQEAIITMELEADMNVAEPTRDGDREGEIMKEPTTSFEIQTPPPEEKLEEL